MNKLTHELAAFAAERDWDQFHSPKNLAMALSVEAGELLEHFQWLTQEESRHLTAQQLACVEAELGDVVIYAANLAMRLGLDPIEAAHKKLQTNKLRYPAEKVRGSAAKYTHYDGEREGE